MSELVPPPTRRGRPASNAAESHVAIMDAVYQLLQETSVRDLTFEAIAKRAKVGRPTLYKWWPSKAAIVLATFHERIARDGASPTGATAEEVIRLKVRRLIREFNGLFGKVMAELIAEGQSEPKLLNELYEQHMRSRRTSTRTDIERGIAAGEFASGTDPELLMDAIFGPIFYRLLIRHAPLTQHYADALLDQVLRGVRCA